MAFYLKNFFKKENRKLKVKFSPESSWYNFFLKHLHNEMIVKHYFPLLDNATVQ